MRRVFRTTGPPKAKDVGLRRLGDNRDVKGPDAMMVLMHAHIPLGAVQTAAKNGRGGCGPSLRGGRAGLSTDKGLLCVMAGAKGLRKIVQTVLGLHSEFQRRIGFPRP